MNTRPTTSLKQAPSIDDQDFYELGESCPPVSAFTQSNSTQYSEFDAVLPEQHRHADTLHSVHKEPTASFWNRLRDIMSISPLKSLRQNGYATIATEDPGFPSTRPGPIAHTDFREGNLFSEDSDDGQRSNGRRRTPRQSSRRKSSIGNASLSDDDREDSDPPDNSIYPEVRASVSALDNTSLSINTPRMWLLTLLFALLGSSANLFFSLRYPSVTINPIIALILVHPLGLAWDIIFKRSDDAEFRYEDGAVVEQPSTSDLTLLTRLRVWLAQGQWNEKEHACVYVGSNVAFAFAFATDVIVEQKKFYKQDITVGYMILLTMSTQILGYAFAGISRRYLVRPPSMIWPGLLASTAMFSTLHKSENKVADGWRITKWRFFVLVWTAAFLWYFVPGLLMPALSYFNVVTWFAPDNAVIGNLFGVSSGLGLLPITFDWAQIAYIGSPLLTPWWAAANVVSGLAIVIWIVAPILYYRNVLYSAFLPMLSSSVFDNHGKVYDVSRILTRDFVFDEDAFKKYSPIYLPVTYFLSYAVQFAGLTALFTHTVCFHGKDIWQQSAESFKGNLGRKAQEQLIHPRIHNSDEFDRTSIATPATSQFHDIIRHREVVSDVHNRLMDKYDDVPIGWYIITGLSMLGIAIFVVEYYPVHLPWYGLLLALSITTVMFIPIAIIMAIANQHFSLYLIAQIVCGYVFPGRPVANMVFTVYCYISSSQAVKFSSDLKLGHYMKIPPKIMFMVQMAATLVSSLAQVGVLNWMFSNVPSLCATDAVNGFSCPLARVHFNGSILWGVVGPHRFFGQDALYHNLIWAFLVGAFAPLALWLVWRKTRVNFLRKINLPLLLGSLSWIPPATALNFSVWTLVCFIFNHHIKRHAHQWWSKYTMTLSAALDSGLAFGLLVIFFGFVFPGTTKNFSWWGTEVYKQGCDWKACSYLKVLEGGHFGPP